MTHIGSPTPPAPGFATQTAALLRTRIRIGAWICLTAIAVFVLMDVLAGEPQPLWVHAVRGGQLGMLVALAVGLRRVSTLERAIAATVAGLAVFCAATPVIGLPAYGFATTALVVILTVLVTATLLPWGARAQAVAAAVSGLGLLGATAWTAHANVEPHLAACTTLAIVLSVYLAHAFEQFRLERWDAEHRLSVSQERSAAEAATSTALARIGREMIATLDRPVILDRLCTRTMEMLGADCSHTLLWRPRDASFVMAAGAGDAAEQLEAMRRVEVPGRVLGSFVDSLRSGEVWLASTRALPGELGYYCRTELTICMALRRGSEIVGVQTAAWRQPREPLDERETRLAEGIASIASLALANATVVEELTAASELKTQFVSTMSHELRTPINVMLGFLEMIEDPEFEPVQRRQLTERLKLAACELHEMIETTLEVGRIDAGRDDGRVEPVRLPMFWRQLGEGCARLPRAEGVDILWSDDVPDLVVPTDPRKLTIVIRNLVGNALKFTEDGSVRVTIERIGDDLVLRVTDTGCGIPFEEQQTVFEMYRQVRGQPPRKSGSGLGLHIVRTFVDRLGGTVLLESVPNAGSQFTVTLPIAGAVPTASAA